VVSHGRTADETAGEMQAGRKSGGGLLRVYFFFFFLLSSSFSNCSVVPARRPRILVRPRECGWFLCLELDTGIGGRSENADVEQDHQLGAAIGGAFAAKESS
jgi:hypothetical protein